MKKSEKTVYRLRESMKLGEQQFRRENTPYHELHNYALSIDGIWFSTTYNQLTMYLCTMEKVSFLGKSLAGNLKQVTRFSNWTLTDLQRRPFGSKCTHASGNLREGIFERPTSTGIGLFALMESGFAKVSGRSFLLS